MSDDNRDAPPVVTGEDEEIDFISTYTRADALNDGALIDVTEHAKKAGIQIPTALTRAVWNEYVELTPAAIEVGNDIEGRRWDILWMLRCAILRTPNEREIRFEVYVVTDRREPLQVTLKAIVKPGDDGKPVITILLPDED